jgi:hypothetical protein
VTINFGPDNDVVTKSKSLKLAVMALGILGIFCLLFWSMFADAKTAGCVTKARLAARDDLQVHDIRWTANGGCEYFASISKPGSAKEEMRKTAISKADALWMPEASVLRGSGTP